MKTIATAAPVLSALAIGTLFAMSPVAQAAADRSAPTAACPQGVLTLRLLRSQNNPPSPAVVAKWEESHPCVTVEQTEVPFGQLADKINVLAASGNPPDVIGYDGPNTQSYAAAGILLPLDKYLPSGFKEDVLPATLKEHSYKGHIYSSGSQQMALALFYNKDMTDAAGIHPLQTLAKAWTWPEAIAAMQKCQKEENGQIAVWGLAPTHFGNGTPGFVYRDLLFARSAGDPKAPQDGSPYRAFYAQSPDGKTVEGWLNTPEAVAADKIYQAMYNGHPITPKGAIPNAFQDRKACFNIDASYLVAALTANDPSFKWGVTPLPYFRTPIVHTGSTTVGVMARTRHPDEAARFVIEVSTGALALQHARARHILPVLKSLYAQMPELSEYPTSIFRDELLQWGEPSPPSVYFAQYDKIVTDALRDIAYGAGPKTRLDTAARTLQPILSR